MAGPTSADEEYWHGVLHAGGATTIPRWTVHPASGVAEHLATVPESVTAAARRLAAELGVPVGSLLLAAHAKVLAALSAETRVVTGYPVGHHARPLPCRLSVEPRTWRALVVGARQAELQLWAHRDAPVEQVAAELGLAIPSYETILDLGGALEATPPEAVLTVGVCDDGSGLGLRLRYRTDALDAQFAHRLAGYHLTALASMTKDPDAVHAEQTLLGEEELRFQLDALAGPRRELPDHRLHELFEQRAARHPDAVAAVEGDRQWTYGELNGRANRVARALLARGLGREDVVAVVTERNLDWMAAVLAVFKAGGTYLPLEPRFPAERIATSLARAECRLVLTEPTSTSTLDQALESLTGTQRLLLDTAYDEGHAADDLGIAVSPDQLAYIFFTSGSTGQPKGAMCEHAGMLNHVLAKISDLEIGEGTVVAQTAPQCFDISLWQLLSALLVGGRTVIVEQDVILDVPRLVDRLVDRGVGVLQVVPSYLEAVVALLEQQPNSLPELRCVSVTGEALKKELVQRWFAVMPHIRLVNAYGLTETSDDTNHEVMDRPPAADRVPLGPPVANVRVYVVDEGLAPVPLGAAGEIAFSGVCVGRGYVNDPERTRLAFMSDPHHEGARLYRSGDYGRWLPEGKLEFLGRRDSQVKVSGFRIEIGDVESALLRVPGVREGAVVVASRAGHGDHLVAFYTGPAPLDPEVVRRRLGASLPSYMVPAVLHWQQRLPLTDNSKIDRKQLSALASDLEAAEDDVPSPSTPTERRLAAAYASVLGIAEDQVGRRDHFFDKGGSSLSAVKLAIVMNRTISLKDVIGHPVLADLAALVDGRAAPPDPRSPRTVLSS
jgi:amino acid adenylation domain-containing protein